MPVYPGALERSKLDIAQTSAILVSRTGPGQYLTGTVSAYCFDIRTQSLEDCAA
jgi:hypothetical protein